MRAKTQKKRKASAGRERTTVAIGFVKGMLSGAASRGVDCYQLLAKAGINTSVLDDPNGRVSLHCYAALYNLVVQTLNDEGFGIFSSPLQLGSFELLCRSIITSRSLEEVLDRSAKFVHVIIPDLLVTVAHEQDAVRIRIAEARPLQADRNDPRRIFALEWILGLLRGLASWMVGREIKLVSAAFPFSRPAHATDYDLVFTPHSIFEADELTVALNANILQLRTRRDDQALAAFLDGAPGKIGALWRDREIFRRVRLIVAKAMPTALTLDDVARQLNLSSRTLHRRLYEEGSSLRAIKDDLRRDAALSKLENTDLSIAEIANELGYADTSTFFRAFTTWTGSSPTAYRRQLQK